MNSDQVLLAVHFVAGGLYLLVFHNHAQSDCHRGLFLFASAATTCLIVGLLLAYWIGLDPERIDRLTEARLAPYLPVMLGLGALYVLRSFALLVAQKRLHSYTYGPLYRLPIVLVVIVAILFLNESAPPLRLWGIGLTLVPIVILGAQYRRARVKKDDDSRPTGATRLKVAIGALVMTMLCGVILQLSSKILLHEDFGHRIPVLLFVFTVNAGNMAACCVALVVTACTKRKDSPWKRPRMSTALGVTAGFLNVLTFVSLSLYLVRGDASVVYPIGALSFMIPVAVLAARSLEPPPRALQNLGLLAASVGMFLLWTKARL